MCNFRFSQRKTYAPVLLKVPGWIPYTTGGSFFSLEFLVLDSSTTQEQNSAPVVPHEYEDLLTGTEGSLTLSGQWSDLTLPGVICYFLHYFHLFLNSTALPNKGKPVWAPVCQLQLTNGG